MAAVRSAESNRLATCKLADRIASISIDTYRRLCPEYLSSSIKQTVISTIVAQIPCKSGDNDSTSELVVLSLGQGTKVMSWQSVLEARSCSLENNEGDAVVRDCHAEVLARRGLLAFLYELVNSSLESDLFVMNEEGRFELKSNVHLHLYSSSQPCGNAAIKKWAKSSKPIQYHDLSSDQIPIEVHNSIQINSRSTGQVAVLVKKNNHTETSRDVDGTPLKSRLYEFPIGTSPTDRGEGNIMTCSDKIAKWNALGIQGALLSQFFEPLYLSTITVGRKFSRVHCERALCCRLQGFCYPCLEEPSGKQSKKAEVSKSLDDNNNQSLLSTPSFVLHHPVMMSTSVKFDESAIITADIGKESSNTEVGAQFTDYRSLCSWRKHSSVDDEWSSEIIDGRSGLLFCDAQQENLSQELAISLISSYSLGKRYRVLTKSSDGYYELKSGKGKDRSNVKEYNEARKLLLSHKDLFEEWIRKPTKIT